MVSVKIDDTELFVDENTTILEAAKKANIVIPTLCFLKGINEIAACRICVVEVENEPKLIPACNTKVYDGMVVHTNSKTVREARRINLELILSRHDNNCNTCFRDGNCELQNIAKKYNIKQSDYVKKIARNKFDVNFPLIREPSKCIGCLRCVNFCEKIQSLGIWALVGTGKNAKVDTKSGKRLEVDDCSLCGQCITHCPVGALHERDDISKVQEKLENKDIIKIVQIAPAVRSAFGEEINLDKDKRTVGRMVASAKALGFDYVFDTDFSADMTIMEESSELIERIQNKGVMPMFTSCCPGWVRFLKARYPEYIPNLSTAKSPQQIFGAASKTYLAKKLNVDPKNIYCVSIMPCVAKKAEADMEEMSDETYGKDVDAVLTTREFHRMLRVNNINVESIKEREFDSPLGTASGAGVIFGTTGGVMEAALRSAHYFITGKNPDPDFIKDYRIDNGIGEFKVKINNLTLNIGVVSGLKNAEIMMEKIKTGLYFYDFVEFMACPSGCAGGGGQPIKEGEEMGVKRGKKLYELDSLNPIRFSHENPEIKEIYKEFFDKPNSHLAHRYLHVTHKK